MSVPKIIAGCNRKKTEQDEADAKKSKKRIKNIFMNIRLGVKQFVTNFNNIIFLDTNQDKRTLTMIIYFY